MKSKILIRSALIMIGVLLVPFFAMQFTEEVDWSPMDFAIMGVILFITSLALQLLIRKGNNLSYRVAAALAILTTFLLIWSNLAVGLIGSGPNPANLMYIGVILTITGGIYISDFRPVGMSNAMIAAAIAQVMVPVLALILFQFQREPGEQFEQPQVVIGVTAFFTWLWVMSALLFRRAGNIV